MAERLVTATIKGVPEFERGAHRLFGRIDDDAPASLLTVADQVATIVRGMVPHQSGALAGSLTAAKDDHGAGVGYNIIYAGPVDYGGWPRGRPYIAGGRYLYPTARAAAAEVRRAGEQGAVKAIRSMSWPRPH